jgi:hypothetical protein
MKNIWNVTVAISAYMCEKENVVSLAICHSSDICCRQNAQYISGEFNSVYEAF